MSKYGKKKINELHNKIATIAAQREQRTAELEVARADLKEAEKVKDEAVKAGNMDGFKRGATAATDAEQRIGFLEASLSALPKTAGREDVTEAWDAYRKEYDADLRKKWAAYKEARAVLANQIHDLVKMQNDALKMRIDLANLIQEKEDALPPVEYIPVRNPKAGYMSSPVECFDVAAMFAVMEDRGDDVKKRCEFDNAVYCSLIARHYSDKLEETL